MQLPKGWHEVSIDQLLKYNTILTSKLQDPIDIEVSLLACFSSVDRAEIEKMRVGELTGLIKKLAFLKELPSTKIAPSFICNGKKYKASLIAEDMTADQFMNFSDILKGVKPEDYLYQMAELIGAMTIRRKFTMKYPFIHYTYDGYKANAAEFRNHLPVSIAYPYFVFFCKVMEKSFPVIQDYLTKELKKLKKSSQKKRWGFLSTGVGTELSTH